LQPAATLTADGNPVGLHFKAPVWISTVDGSEVGAAPVAWHRLDLARRGRSRPSGTRRCTASGRPPPDLLNEVDGRRSNRSVKHCFRRSIPTVCRHYDVEFLQSRQPSAAVGHRGPEVRRRRSLEDNRRAFPNDAGSQGISSGSRSSNSTRTSPTVGQAARQERCGGVRSADDAVELGHIVRIDGCLRASRIAVEVVHVVSANAHSSHGPAVPASIR
jgi:hypothetical protein